MTELKRDQFFCMKPNNTANLHSDLNQTEYLCTDI